MARKSVHVTASGSISSTPCKVLAVYGLGGASAGSVTLKDGGSSGTALRTVDSPATGVFGGVIKGGLEFATNCYATLNSTAPAGVTVDYEDYT